eukprot:2408178-Rhodomonas_salina.1
MRLSRASAAQEAGTCTRARAPETGPSTGAIGASAWSVTPRRVSMRTHTRDRESGIGNRNRESGRGVDLEVGVERLLVHVLEHRDLLLADRRQLLHLRQ